MPHLDVVSYITQYTWALFILMILFYLILSGVLPILQQQFVLRVWAEEELKKNRNVSLIKDVGSLRILKGLVNEKW